MKKYARVRCLRTSDVHVARVRRRSWGLEVHPVCNQMWRADEEFDLAPLAPLTCPSCQLWENLHREDANE